jgi:hypothetical protein
VRYKLGLGVHHKHYEVCSKCFRHVYGVKRTMFYNIRHEIRQGFVTSSVGDRISTDGSGRQCMKNNPAFVHALIEFAKRRGITLDKYQMASLAVPNTPAALTMFAWLDDYFDLVGEDCSAVQF